MNAHKANCKEFFESNYRSLGASEMQWNKEIIIIMDYYMETHSGWVHTCQLNDNYKLYAFKNHDISILLLQLALYI